MIRVFLYLKIILVLVVFETEQFGNEEFSV